ncbi:hypothetical protein [Herbaspirillum chlorophenolicum]|uniref:hypothetical protein n=1 Tax=Herbaspirillum chlorophenolicum TaxID=211589 RepID=UPI00067B5B7A|nr:hypothetical protein [Herbaspirillum chlorophenolicum]
MSDTDDAPKTPLPLSILGLAAAFGLALWAGIHYMTHDASLFYGLLAGLSFGAAFAFGQQIKNRIVPSKKRKTDWKVHAPGAAELSPAKLAAQQARKISVEFDDEEIRTMANGLKREGVAWSAVNRVDIVISDEFLPLPQWMIGGDGAEGAKGIIVPNDAEGLDALMEAMKARLPGYDNDATYQTIISAMAAMEGHFPVWSRKPA